MHYTKLNNILIGALLFSTASFSFSTAQADDQSTLVCIEAWVGSNIELGVPGYWGKGTWTPPQRVNCGEGTCGFPFCTWMPSDFIRDGDGIRVRADDAYNGKYNTVCSSHKLGKIDYNQVVDVKLYYSLKNHNFWCEWSQQPGGAKPNAHQLLFPISPHKPSPTSPHKPSSPSAPKGQLKK